MTFPDRQAIDVCAGKPQFSQRELFTRVNESVDRDPAFFVIRLLSFVAVASGFEQLMGKAIDFVELRGDFGGGRLRNVGNGKVRRRLLSLSLGSVNEVPARADGHDEWHYRTRAHQDFFDQHHLENSLSEQYGRRGSRGRGCRLGRMQLRNVSGDRIDKLSRNRL